MKAKKCGTRLALFALGFVAFCALAGAALPTALSQLATSLPTDGATVAASASGTGRVFKLIEFGKNPGTGSFELLAEFHEW
jgi:hypothetical protein